MRFTTHKPRLLATAALALVASTASVGVASADTPAAAHSASHVSAVRAHSASKTAASSIASLLGRGRGRGCVVLANLSEHFISGTVTGAGPDPTKPQIGQHGVYSMRILNGAGDQIGTMMNGTTDVYAQALNGHFLVHGNERVNLNDGAIHAEGNYDLTETLAHTWQSVPAVGTSGRYRGMRGVELFRDVTNPVLFDEAFILCR